MKTIEQIFAQAKIEDIIKDLKRKTVKVPAWSELVKEYDPMQHRIMADRIAFPDKDILDDNDAKIGTEPITRVVIGLQKLAVKRMAEFMFTIPVNPLCEGADDNELIGKQFDALKKVLKKTKWNTLNKRRCKIICSECEQATYWYTVADDRNEHYGFPTEVKIKNTVFSPSNGDALYPLFDPTGDMIAFSREFILKDADGKDILYFETWTKDNFYQWTRSGADWVEAETRKITIGKIPIVYSNRHTAIWRDADNGKVHEIELLLSRNGDILAYHSAPVLVVRGKLLGAPTKGESNKVFTTTDPNAGAEYVSYAQSPEMTAFQFETLWRMFFSELQLPDLSLENMRGLGDISGEAMKRILTDALLKVGDESEIYEDLLDREYSIIKAYLGEMNRDWKTSIQQLEIESEIRPFAVEDEKARVEVLIAANGGKPLVSQERSVELSGLTENPGKDFIRIEAERVKDNTSYITEPTI